MRIIMKFDLPVSPVPLSENYASWPEFIRAFDAWQDEVIDMLKEMPASEGELVDWYDV